jgi:trimeric autotransporter adhesin
MALIKGKQIDNQTVIISGSTGNVIVSGLLDTNGNQVFVNIAPTDDQHLTNKAYVDAVAQGVRPHAPAVVVSTTNISLSGLQTIDDISLSEGERVLVAGQTNTVDNGIYGATTGTTWQRTEDADGSITNEVQLGDFVFITSGTTNNNSGWVLGKSNTSTPPDIVPGTDTQEWYKMAAPGSYTADGEGIVLAGNEFQLELDGSTLTKSASGVKLNDTLSTTISTNTTNVTSLSTALSSEISTTNSDITSLSTELSTEISTRDSADTSLSTAIGTGDSSLSTAISTEISTRGSADTSLSTELSTEISTTDSEVTSLSTAIGNIDFSSIETELSTEISTRESADTSLSTELSTEISTTDSEVTSLSTAISSGNDGTISLSTALSTEISTSTSADTSLSTAISTGDSSLSTAISTESSTRSSADTSLSTSIGTGDSSLSTALSTEISTSASADTSLESAIDNINNPEVISESITPANPGSTSNVVVTTTAFGYGTGAVDVDSVTVYLNGIQYPFAYASGSSVFHTNSVTPTGTNITLYFDGTVAGFGIETDDTVIMKYLVVT